MNTNEIDESNLHAFPISWDIIEILAEDLEQRFPNERVTSATLISLYYAAKLNHAIRLVATLNGITNKELLKCLVNIHYDELDGHVVTPLTIAAIQNNTTFVKTLLSHYDVDVEKECNVLFDGLVVYGATALWIAASMGHMQIVKLLVKHGADVNHNNKAHSSPLRAACYDGRLEIVRYLIQHGANVNLANAYNNTSIMIAAYKGHIHVVDTLLKNGANPNGQALCGATALHYAAECGHLEVCRMLLDHGAKILKNENNLTPVLLAAERVHEDLVNLFIERPELMSKIEIITALELLGASYANDKKNYNITKAYDFLMRAMEMRYSDPENVLRKNVMAPVPAYDDWFETENIAELKAIRLNHHSIHMEALTIRERIMGKHNIDLVQPIVHRGAIMADLGRYAQCQSLWNYAIDLCMINNVSVEDDLQRFVQLFVQILSTDIENLDLSIVLSVLVKCQQEMETNKYKIRNPGPKDVPRLLVDHNDQNILTAMQLIKIISKRISHAPNKIDKSQIELLYATIYQFIKSDTRLHSDGQTMLHLACNSFTSLHDTYSADAMSFPCYRTALILVHVGAPINALDDLHRTPLHTLVNTIGAEQAAPSKLADWEKSVKLLVEAGAHLDSVDFEDKTPAQTADIPGITNLILNYQNARSTLKCLAARAISVNKISYQGMIPQTLESFIKMHTPGTKSPDIYHR